MGMDVNEEGHDEQAASSCMVLTDDGVDLRHLDMKGSATSGYDDDERW